MNNQSQRFGQLFMQLYVGVNVLALGLCLFALYEMWGYRPMLNLLLSRIPLINTFGGLVPMWALFGLVGVFTLVGLVKTVGLLAGNPGDSLRGVGQRLRAAVYLAFATLFVCVFILSTPEAFSGPFRLRHPIMAWIAASIACGVWWLLPQLRFGLSDPAIKRIDLVALNICITLVLAEVTLWAAALVSSSPLLVTESTSSQIRRESERMPPGSVRFSFPVNSLGFYDTEFLPRSERSRPLVVTIGDSFAYGVVPHYFHYTTVAEREFEGAEIYNIGFPGTNPTDYLYHVTADALPLEPDLIVVALYVGNDLAADPPVDNPMRWYDAESYLLGVVWHRLKILRIAKAHDWTRENDSASGDDLVARYPWINDPSLEPPSLGEDIYLELESRNAFLGAADHRGVYERFFAALRRIEEEAGDTPLAFMIIPSEYQVNDALWEIVVERNELPLQRDLPQQKILEWARVGNRVVLDLLPLMLSVEPMEDGQRHLYHLRDGHFNARGNAVAGSALAGLVERRLSGTDDSDIQAFDTAQALAGSGLLGAGPSGEMSLEEASAIVQDFGGFIGGLGFDGKTVYDESVLGRSKLDIKKALATVLRIDTTEEERNFYRELGSVLAFFQPGVGKDGVSIDATRNDQTTWRSVVETEIRETAHYFVKLLQK